MDSAPPKIVSALFGFIFPIPTLPPIIAMVLFCEIFTPDWSSMKIPNDESLETIGAVPLAVLKPIAIELSPVTNTFLPKAIVSLPDATKSVPKAILLLPTFKSFHSVPVARPTRNAERDLSKKMRLS